MKRFQRVACNFLILGVTFILFTLVRMGNICGGFVADPFRKALASILFLLMVLFGVAMLLYACISKIGGEEDKMSKIRIAYFVTWLGLCVLYFTWQTYTVGSC